MMSRRVFSFLLFFLFSQILSFAFNPLQSNNPQIVQDVIEKIALKQKWELEGLNFSKLELSKVRFGTGKRCEFRIRFGKTHLLFKFPDEVSSLKKFTKRSSNDFLDFVNEINSSAVLEPFTMEGPFELRLSPGHQASLLFPLELEKEIGNNESVRGMLAEWRTKPTVERLWFDVMTRVEGDKLKPLLIKKVRPFVSGDTVSWSNLLSNISFTKFPSILVPPEALTLDVKW